MSARRVVDGLEPARLIVEVPRDRSPCRSSNGCSCLDDASISENWELMNAVKGINTGVTPLRTRHVTT